MKDSDLCHNCQKRCLATLNGHPATCHAVCKDYQEKADKRAKELEEIRKIKEDNFVLHKTKKRR